MVNPMLSIIIPTFNVAESITQALESILSQKFEDYEVLVIDGCSSDNTGKIVQEHSKKNKCIRWISEKDNGVYDAMNKGIQKAKGIWLYFLGADDRLYNSKVLEEIFSHPEVHDYNVVYGNVQIVGNTAWSDNGTIYDGEFNLRKLLRKNICHQSILYKKNFVESIGYYNTDYKLCADWDYNLRCRAKTKFLYIDKVVAFFVAGGTTTKSNVDTNFSINFLQNVIGYFQLSPFHSLLNDVSFPYYYDVLSLQRKKNILRYVLNRIAKKMSSVKK